MHNEKDKIGVVVSTAMSITIVVGAGLLVLPGMSFALAGRHGYLPWMMVGAFMVPLLYIFAYFAATNPSAGGVVGYIRESLGPRLGSMAEMIVLGTFTLGIPAIALIGSGYLRHVMPELTLIEAGLSIVTLAFVAGIVGLRISGAIQTGIATIIVIGLSSIGIGFLTTQSPAAAVVEADTIATNWSGVFRAIPVILFAYTGWEMTAFLAEDMKNPKRTMPISIWASFVVVVIMYVFIAWVVALAATQEERWKIAPFVELAKGWLGSAGAQVVAMIAALLVVANVIVAFLSASRAIYAAGREGLLSRKIGVLNGQKKPMIAMTLTWGVFTAVIVLSQSAGIGVDSLLQLAGQNFFVLYLLAAYGYTRKHARTAGHQLLGCIAILSVVAMLFLFSLPGLLYCLGLAVIGIMMCPKEPLLMAANDSRSPIAPVE
jgi:amino acid efflux transporter